MLSQSCGAPTNLREKPSITERKLLQWRKFWHIE